MNQKRKSVGWMTSYESNSAKIGYPVSSRAKKELNRAGCSVSKQVHYVGVRSTTEQDREARRCRLLPTVVGPSLIVTTSAITVRRDLRCFFPSGCLAAASRVSTSFVPLCPPPLHTVRVIDRRRLAADDSLWRRLPLRPITYLSPVHTSNNVECYNVECCFDIVAVFGNNVEATFDIVAKNGNNVERVLPEISSFRQSRTLLRQCSFDIVASVDRALVVFLSLPCVNWAWRTVNARLTHSAKQTLKISDYIHCAAR